VKKRNSSGIAFSPAEKAVQTRAAFLAKVELLECWATSGSFSAGAIPNTLAQFAAWEDPNLGIKAWKKANIVSSPKYNDLRSRYDQAMERLRDRSEKKLKSEDERKKRLAAEREIVVIAQQLVRERFAHKATEKKLRLARAAGEISALANGPPRLRIVEK
jgi:hypothetical protein